MKILIISDTHLGMSKNKKIWLDVVTDFFKHILDVCKQQNIDTIFHLGDFFDERKAIGTKTLNQALEIAHMFNNFNMFICMGNHDLYADNTPYTSLKIFEKFKNIHVISSPYKFSDEILLLPWNSKEFMSAKYVFGHFPINGFSMNNFAICNNSDFSPDMFLTYHKVFSGHFHLKTTRKIGQTTFYYVGSPYHQDFGDVNTKRGYHIFDTETSDVEFIEYTKAPKFMNIKAEYPVKIQRKKIQGNIIKLIYFKDYGTLQNSEILETIQKLDPLLLYTDFSNISIQEDNDFSVSDEITLKTSEEILLEYIETTANLPEFVNNATLKTMIKNLIEEDIKNEFGN